MSRRQTRNLLSALVAGVYAVTGSRVSERLYRELQSKEVRAVDGDLTTERLAFLVENAVKV